jgi:hypothetical protein
MSDLLRVENEQTTNRSLHQCPNWGAAQITGEDVRMAREQRLQFTKKDYDD